MDDCTEGQATSPGLGHVCYAHMLVATCLFLAPVQECLGVDYIAQEKLETKIVVD